MSFSIAVRVSLLAAALVAPSSWAQAQAFDSTGKSSGVRRLLPWSQGTSDPQLRLHLAKGFNLLEAEGAGPAQPCAGTCSATPAALALNQPGEASYASPEDSVLEVKGEPNSDGSHRRAQRAAGGLVVATGAVLGSFLFGSGLHERLNTCDGCKSPGLGVAQMSVGVATWVASGVAAYFILRRQRRTQVNDERAATPRATGVWQF